MKPARRRALFVSGMFSFAFLPLSAADADAAAHFTGQYRIVNKNSGKALDVSDFSLRDGANIHQWRYVGGDNQKWIIQSLSNGYYTLTAAHSGKAVDVRSGGRADGANIHQWTPNGTYAQQFKIEEVSAGLYKITNRGSGKVLDVASWSTTDGGNVQQWRWGEQSNQKWEIIPIDADVELKGEVSIRAKFNDKALEVSAASMEIGATIDLVDDVGDDQRWTLEPAGGGYYRVRAKHSGQLLSVESAAQVDGAALVQTPDNGADAQLFAFLKFDDGYVLRNKNSGKAVALAEWGNYNGAPVVQWTATGLDDQKWRLTPQANPACAQYAAPVKTGKAPSVLNETSGLVVSSYHPHRFWAHNDSGASAKLYSFNSAGALSSTVTLANARPVDWEDLARATCSPGSAQSCLFIGDIGDNSRARDSIKIYKLPEPNPDAGDHTLNQYEVMRAVYEDGPHNAEALVVDENNDIVILTKSSSRRFSVYRAPFRAGATAATFRFVGSVDLSSLPTTELVTAADYQIKTRRLLVRTYGYMLEFQLRPDQTLDDLGDAPWRRTPAGSEPQGETAAYGEGGYWHVSESAGAAIWRIGCKE